jgi:hypothetical protein
MVTSTPSENLSLHLYEYQNKNFNIETLKTLILHARFLQKSVFSSIPSSNILYPNPCLFVPQSTPPPPSSSIRPSAWSSLSSFLPSFVRLPVCSVYSHAHVRPAVSGQPAPGLPVRPSPIILLVRLVPPFILPPARSFVRLSRPSNILHCNENPTYVFLFWEKRGLSPNFHIHVSVSDLYSTSIGLHISSSRIGRLIVEIYKSLTAA